VSSDAKLKDGHRMRVPEKRQLRRIFGHKRDDVTRWRKLHNNKFHNFYAPKMSLRRNISRSTRYIG
jgi:hypothetical protein